MLHFFPRNPTPSLPPWPIALSTGNLAVSSPVRHRGDDISAPTPRSGPFSRENRHGQTLPAGRQRFPLRNTLPLRDDAAARLCVRLTETRLWLLAERRDAARRCLPRARRWKNGARGPTWRCGGARDARCFRAATTPWWGSACALSARAARAAGNGRERAGNGRGERGADPWRLGQNSR